MAQMMANIVQGDADYDINFALTDATGAVVDLTGATLVLNAQSVADPTAQFSGAMSIVSAVAGTCKYTVAATDFAVTGDWNAQVVVTYPSTEKVTFSDILFIVDARIPV
jgi:hypothetical protein